MKKINTNISSKLDLAAFLALGTLTVTTSCNNNKNEIGQELPDGKAQVIVRIAGINDGSVSTSMKASNSRTSNNSFELSQGNGYDLITAVDDKIVENSSIKAASGKKGASVANGIKYRVFLYKKTGATYTYDQSVQFVAGQETPISVSNGATYKWVALSYNNTDDIVDRTGSDNVALPENKDVLYAASAADFTVSGTSVPLSITFNHHFSRIALDVNTKGIFAKVQSATAAVTGLDLKTGTIDLTTGDFVGSLTSVTKTVSLGDFNNLNTYGDNRTAYFYTANNTQQNIAVSFSNVTVEFDNGDTRNIGTIAKTFTITPVRGSNHRLLLAPIESALTYGSVSGVPVRWSRSNLYYKNSVNPENPYRFNHTNVYSATTDPNSFFAFKGHLPRRLASAVAANQIDPCSRVYPAGLWKTPSQAEMAVTTNSSGVLGNLLGSIGTLLGIGATPGAVTGANYIEYTPTAGVSSVYGASTSALNKLRFNYNGIQTSVGLVQGLITLDLATSKGTSTGFWTNTQGVNLLTLVGAGSWNYIGFTGRNLVGGSVPRGSAAANLLNIDAVGLNVVSSALMNVRCVRDDNWTTISASPTYNPDPVLPATSDIY
jgi:hypothetical protein